MRLVRAALTRPISLLMVIVSQARARYQVGLSTALKVADAQKRLTEAEIDNSRARLSIWRAHLAMLEAEGDIAPVLKEASEP